MAALLAIAFIALGGVFAAPSQPVNEDAAIQAALQKRIADYAALHQKLEATLPPLPKDATADQIEKHRRAMAALLQKARPDAKRGDIFPPAARALIRRYLARVLSGPEGATLKSAMQEEGAGRINLQVNGRYPDGAPHSMMPPQVLAALPKLPEELEYRVIGERLILLDFHAHVVVDFIENALPD